MDAYIFARRCDHGYGHLREAPADATDPTGMDANGVSAPGRRDPAGYFPPRTWREARPMGNHPRPPGGRARMLTGLPRGPHGYPDVTTAPTAPQSRVGGLGG